MWRVLICSKERLVEPTSANFLPLRASIKLRKPSRELPSMLEDALAAAAQERDAVASAFAERRAQLRLLRMLRRCTPSLHKLTDKQQRGVLGVQRRRCHRLAFEGAARAHV